MHPFIVAADVRRSVSVITRHADPEVDAEDAIDIVFGELDARLACLDNSSSDIIDNLGGVGTDVISVTARVWFDFFGSSFEDGASEAAEALKEAVGPQYELVWLDADTDYTALQDMIYEEAVAVWSQLERDPYPF